jgi:hypothetical protein
MKPPVIHLNPFFLMFKVEILILRQENELRFASLLTITTLISLKPESLLLSHLWNDGAYLSVESHSQMQQFFA